APRSSWRLPQAESALRRPESWVSRVWKPGSSRVNCIPAETDPRPSDSSRSLGARGAFSRASPLRAREGVMRTKQAESGAPIEEPLAELERQLISEFLAAAGQDFHTLLMR